MSMRHTKRSGWLHGLSGVLLGALASLSAASLAAAEIAAEKIVHLTGPVAEVDLQVGLHGLTLVADAPVELRGSIHCEPSGSSGLTATVISNSLRGVTEDDWRTSRPIAGTRQHAQVAFTSQAFGTPAERVAWAIDGSHGDWDNYSIQWDGWLRVESDNTDLATASDDGSRLWLDRNRNGKIDPGEWGSNGWGNGQGTTQRVVHRKVARGLYRIRLQFEEGGGGNSCSLLWKDKTGAFTPIPAEGFQALATLALRGPITLAAQISGPGEVRLGTGVRLAQAPNEADLTITGTVILDPALTRLENTVRIATDGELNVGAGSLACPLISGSGSIRLAGGVLELPSGTTDLRLLGNGVVRIAGDTFCADFAPTLQIDQGILRSTQRCQGRLALATPLTTILPLVTTAAGKQRLSVTLDIPADAPGDLGLGTWRADRQGRWFQRLVSGTLAPGRHELALDLGADDLMAPEGHAGRWTGDAGADADTMGIFFYSTQQAQALVRISATWTAATLPAATSTAPRLADVDMPTAARTGKRWELTVRPDPYPVSPCDPDFFQLDLAVTAPDGTTTTYAGFHHEPVQALDDGDRERFVTAGPPHFSVRFRPRMAGKHTLQLTALWKGGRKVSVQLPAIEATGAAWDDIVRVDEKDPRFFSAGGRFVWPAGCNLNSTYDVRSESALETTLTPHRGSFTRMAFLERLAAGGANGCEIWLSPWNLGLEWIPLWPGFRGTSRYHQGNAWALDQFLDRAEELGMRVNVSIFNHGMARNGGSAEDDWKFHPYGVGQGGWLSDPAGLFEDERAFTKQRALFRYLAARYGDSPAVLGWKLWAEVNLANAPRESIRDWHARASAAFHELDPWDHPVTTHWCGDWNNVDREIATIPTMNYLTIDAYKGDDTLIADLLCQSTRDPLARRQGLSWAKKPVLTTEFGGSAGATNRPRMRAEHAIGPWAGMVAGHAGSPMLWWFEWIDQEDRFAVYGGINRFLTGEDLRDPKAQTIAPSATAQGASLWCRAWSRPGRLLGYVLDREWGMGEAAKPMRNAGIVIGEDVRAGTMILEWWNADLGTLIARQELEHPGGRLELKPSTFERHLAFKLFRP